MVELLFTKKISDDLLTSFSKDLFLVHMRDFIAIRYICLPKKPTLNNVLIFTSTNGVKGFLHNFSVEQLKGKNICTVGDQTAFFIEKMGVKVAIKKDYAREFSLLKEELPNGPYDWFCGTRSLKHMIDSLKGRSLNRYEVYDTLLCPHAIKRSYHALVFFSPSAVASFIEKNDIPQNAAYFAIGKTTCEALLLAGASSIFHPKKPSTVSLIDLIKKHFHVKK